ncbi:MAG: tRNA (N(6)-L-threonylcarbamoyladenosine(37)-C(2))-methylthiotransferase [Candidatus Bathyarchaeota archaeon]|nr:tRNA (N(6)-L-threonylcarbamoyladenosine(37)-C(2))-methylthiotransferase [Candidatus Bathyarchaeota archaeon]
MNQDIMPTYTGKCCWKDRSVYVESYGCAANRFDLEIMLYHLFREGYHLVQDPTSASLILMNTCGVKKPTEDKILQRLSLLSKLGRPIVISGCLPKIDYEGLVKVAPDFSAMLDPWSVDRIIEVVRSAESGEKNRIFFSDEPTTKIYQPKIRINPCVEIISVSEGCTGACAFCCVRFARGKLFSYPKEAIVERVREAVSEGVKEIWLTSQDMGAYGLDNGAYMPTLLDEICQINGKFFCRVGMMNPDNVMRMLDDLISSFKHEKILKFLHIPVQSGDDEILRRMNRKYRVEDFKKIVWSFRKEIPDITISTDVICGFPGESREAFQNTVKLILEVQPDVVNISKFYPRPKTPAAEMEQIDRAEVNYRSRSLVAIVKEVSLRNNLRWIGWEGEILVDEKGKGLSWVGRNYAYKPIVVKCDGNLLGRFVRVRVIEARPTYLEAEIIN